MSSYCTGNDEKMLRLDTDQRTAKRLTRTQADALRRVRDRGSLAWCMGKGRAGGAVARMFHRLREDGLVSGPPYVVTLYGRRVLAILDERASSPSSHQSATPGELEK